MIDACFCIDAIEIKPFTQQKSIHGWWCPAHTFEKERDMLWCTITEVSIVTIHALNKS